MADREAAKKEMFGPFSVGYRDPWKIDKWASRKQICMVSHRLRTFDTQAGVLATALVRDYVRIFPISYN